MGGLPVRVLDVGGSAAVRLAGRLLADVGADVVASRPTGADPVWDCGKRVIERPLADDELAQLAAGAHVLLDGRLSSAAWLRAQGGVRCFLPTLPDGDGREVPPGVADARAGLYQPPIGAPRVHPLQIGSLVAALHAATAALASLRSGPVTRWIEVTELDAALHAQELRVGATTTPASSLAALRWATSPFAAAYRCADGRFLYVHAGMPAHAERLRGVIPGLPVSAGTARDPMEVASVGEARAIGRALAAAFLAQPAGAWEEALAKAGVAAAVCRTPAEWREHPQSRATGQWQRADGADVPGPLLDGVAALRAPARVDAAPWEPVRRAGVREDPPLAGLRVLELSQIIAGPVAGRTLARLGASVDKLQAPHLALPWSRLFRRVYDAGKALRTEHLSGPEDLRHWLAPAPDVVLHNLRPAAAARLGLDPVVFGAGWPRTVLASVNAYGSGGPWDGRPGWEQTAQAATGIQAAYGGARPSVVPLPALDLCAGLGLAFGVTARLLQGRGGSVSVGLTRAAAWLSSDPQVSVRRDRYEVANPRGGPAWEVPRAGLGRALADRGDAERRRPDGHTEVASPWRGPGLGRFTPLGWRADEAAPEPSLVRGVGWGVYAVSRWLRGPR